MFASLAANDFFWTAMVHLGLAIVCGGAIGLERQLRGKAAGLRTCIIVVLTTTMLVELGQEATETTGDPSRVMAAIITGIGFIGGGVIFAQGRRIQGITTASLIWALAAIGIAVGLGYGLSAVLMTAAVTIVMVAVDWAERRFPALRRGAIPTDEH